MTSNRRTIVRGVVVALLMAAGAIATYVFRASLRDVLNLDTLLGRFTSLSSSAPARPGMPMTSGAQTPGAEPPRGEISIDTRRQQLIGVRVTPVVRTRVSAIVRSTGVARYDETRQTDVNVRLDGWIRDLYVNFTGQPVQRGDRLFSLYSPELVATQNEFILALKNRDEAQASTLTESRDYADRLVEATRQRLMLWNLSAEELRTLEETRQPLQTVTIAAPVSGFILEKSAIAGMRVTPGQTLYRIADVSSVWIEADVYEQDISLIRIGQTASVALDAYPGQTFTGRAVYLHPSLDPQTRTMKVRVQFANARGRLKPGMFANVELRGPEHDGLTVPADAVLDAGAQQTVFVAEGDGRFIPRRVTVGRRVGDVVEITAGLEAGEEVATSAAFFLDSESQLRAGLQNYEAAQTAAATSVSQTERPLDIQFRSTTDPPKTGDNTFEVRVTQSGGRPVTDATVSVQLFMAAMPTMNMPAMRNEMTLPHAVAGVYRGPGQVLMGGRWDVTVTVARGGQRMGSKQFVLVTR